MVRKALDYFPGETARASLKQFRVPAGDQVAFAFPGRNGPGLIEAAGTPLTSAESRGYFPGETARASLKLGGPAELVELLGRNFPGETARASLKH